jgi:hypothetical protein
MISASDLSLWSGTASGGEGVTVVITISFDTTNDVCSSVGSRNKRAIVLFDQALLINILSDQAVYVCPIISLEISL